MGCVSRIYGVVTVGCVTRGYVSLLTSGGNRVCYARVR